MARFDLRDDTLEFQPGNVTQIDLSMCLLDIEVAGKTETCTLNNPRQIAPVQIKPESGMIQREKLPLADRDVFMEVSFDSRELGEIKVRPNKPIWREESVTITVPNPKGVGSKKYLEIEIEFVKRNPQTDFDLSIELFFYPIRVDFRGSTVKENAMAFELDELAIQEARVSLKELKFPQELLRLKNLVRSIEEAQDGLKNRKSRLENVEWPKRREELVERMASRPLKEFDEEVAKTKKAFARTFKRLDNYMDAAKKYSDWITNVEGLLERIHNDGRIHLRVFVEVENKQLDLVQTR